MHSLVSRYPGQNYVPWRTCIIYYLFLYVNSLASATWQIYHTPYRPPKWWRPYHGSHALELRSEHTVVVTSATNQFLKFMFLYFFLPFSCLIRSFFIHALRKSRSFTYVIGASFTPEIFLSRENSESHFLICFSDPHEQHHRPAIYLYIHLNMVGTDLYTSNSLSLSLLPTSSCRIASQTH